MNCQRNDLLAILSEILIRSKEIHRWKTQKFDRQPSAHVLSSVVVPQCVTWHGRTKDTKSRAIGRDRRSVRWSAVSHKKFGYLFFLSKTFLILFKIEPQIWRFQKFSETSSWFRVSDSWETVGNHFSLP